MKNTTPFFYNYEIQFILEVERKKILKNYKFFEQIQFLTSNVLR